MISWKKTESEPGLKKYYFDVHNQTHKKETRMSAARSAAASLARHPNPQGPAPKLVSGLDEDHAVYRLERDEGSPQSIESVAAVFAALDGDEKIARR